MTLDAADRPIGPPSPEAVPSTRRARPPLSSTLLLTVLAPYAAALVLLDVVVLSATVGWGGVLSDGQLFAGGAVTTWGQVATLILLGYALPVLALPFCVVAGVAVAASETYGVRPSARAAWQWALRRRDALPRVTGVALVAGFAMLVVQLPLVAVLVILGLPAWAAYLVGGAVLAAFCPAFARSLRTLVVDHLLPGGWSARSWVSAPQDRSGGDERSQRTLALAAGFIGVQGALRISLPDVGTGVVVVLSMAFVLIVAQVTRDVVGDVMLRDWERPPPCPLADAPRPRPGAARRRVVAVGVALASPVVAAPVIAWINPWGAASVTTTQTPPWQDARDLLLVGDTVLLLPVSGTDGDAVIRCDGAVCDERSWTRGPFPMAVAVRDGNTWGAQWEAAPAADESSRVPVRLTLWQGATADPPFDARPSASSRTWDVDDSTLALHDLASDLGSPVGDNDALPVLAASESDVAVASVLRQSDQESELRISTCREGRCEVAAAPIPWVRPRADSAPDLALGEDGTAYVAVAGTRWEGREGVGASLFVRDGAGTVHERVLMHPLTWLSDRQRGLAFTDPEAAVEVAPDGTVWVLYRLPHDDEGVLVRCDDPLCSTWSQTGVPGLVTARGALVVDGSGRPQAVTTGHRDEVARLWSCQDLACAETDEVAVPGLGRTHSSRVRALIALDDDRPVIAVASYPLSEHGQIIRCQQPRCGAS